MAVKLIFIHIPKTGGQSIRDILLPHGKIHNSYSILGKRPEDDLDLYENADGLIEMFKNSVDSIPNDTVFIQDHAHIRFFEDVFPEAKRVTILRDPVDRVVSAYNYEISTGRISPDTPIREFAKRVDQVNVQCHLTNGDLSEFDLVGRFDEFDKFVNDLCELIDIPVPSDIPHVNTGKDFELGKGDGQSIARRNKLDKELWSELTAN